MFHKKKKNTWRSLFDNDFDHSCLYSWRNVQEVNAFGYAFNMDLRHAIGIAFGHRLTNIIE